MTSEHNSATGRLPLGKRAYSKAQMARALRGESFVPLADEHKERDAKKRASLMARDKARKAKHALRWDTVTA